MATVTGVFTDNGVSDTLFLEEHNWSGQGAFVILSGDFGGGFVGVQLHCANGEWKELISYTGDIEAHVDAPTNVNLRLELRGSVNPDLFYQFSAMNEGYKI